MAQRIEVMTVSEDGRAKVLEQDIHRIGKKAAVKIVDVYTLENDLAQPELLARSLVNPVTQKLLSRGDEGDFDWAVEIGFLPGVTDNIGHTVSELAALTLNDNQPVYSSQVIYLKGALDKPDVTEIASSLHNPLIQRAAIKSAKQYREDGGMDIIVPKVCLSSNHPAADDVDLDIPDEELAAIGTGGIKNADGTRRGPLGMSLLYMKAVQDYFKKQGRPAKDIEIETLAQTWSEHCKHTIFASPIDDVKDGVYRHYIKRATKEIRAARGDDDFCISVFSDNAGGIVFDENWIVTHKVETHNSPSALDPVGGAMTGTGGVNRDAIGFGLGCKPIINTYGFCFAPPDYNPEYYRGKGKINPILPPVTIVKGVVHGINHYGNCSGIPTPQGFVYFDERYAGKPLVFAGTVGLIPRVVGGKAGHEKCARPGDRIVMVGGRVGRDGIHGATFSSVALDEGSPATAVQIGDPITQKKMSDAIVKEIRDLGLYTAITDNGAGGLSSSVGEMGEGSGGFVIALDKVPLKYPGMQPWEIWISESQERMTLAVPPENVEKLIALFAKRGVEAWDIGEFTDSGKAQAKWNGEIIMDIAMDFLHD
ncbi:MAG: AIR synthase-related protein, partial [Micavibrio sp.]